MDAQWDERRRGDGRLLKRVGPLVGAMIISLGLLGAAAPCASATGFYLAGEESTEEANQPRFEAESYPTYARAGQAEAYGNKLILDGEHITVECEQERLYGPEMSGGAATLSFQPWHSLCQARMFGLAFAVSFYANGCEYAFGALNAGPPYAGDFGVECSSEAGYTIVVYTSLKHLENDEPYVVFTLPAQSGIEGIDYENTGEGAESAVAASLNLSGIKYTQECFHETTYCESGEREDGVLTGSEVLFAEEYP